MIESCTRVRAAVAYASRDNMKLFEACAQHLKPLEFFGRYDHTVAVDPAVLKWFLDKASPNFDCKLVPDILHAKVIWWVDAGAYIGSANLSDRAWISNIEAGTFLPHDELVETGMERELQRFFEEVDDRAQPLTKEIYQEQLRLADRRSELSKREYGLEQQFDKDRLLPKNQGLVFVDTKRSSEKRFQKFEQDWNDTLQVMRSIASRVSAPGAKPGWIDASVAPGVQADQFLHAYYYKQVKDGNRHPYEEFFARNSKNPELALRDALEWWWKRHGPFTGSITSFRRALARSGVVLPRGQASHALRHTFASHFMQKGGNILVLQKILGHSSLAMTMRYAHLAPEHLADAVKLSPLADVTLLGHS